jgi:membrane associated rhomboid family serine protease
MIVPIGTDVRLRRKPVGNIALIVLNILVFIGTDGTQGWLSQLLHAVLPPLNAGAPALHEYLTYQLRHGNATHLIGNMLFLWVFGNAVCDRMGSLPYVVFYLASGVFAGFIYALTSSAALVGASGSIAAVTTAFLVLYPRVHIALVFFPLIFWVFQIPAMLLIVGKIILWDNIIAPNMLHREVQELVAFSAHLGGYAFGFAVSLALLAGRALPRNQFDLLALWNRWRRRSGLTAEVSFDGASSPRPVVVEELNSRPLDSRALSETEQLREDVIDRIAEHDLREAVRLYERLISVEPQMILPRAQQLAIARQLAQEQRYAAAVDAFERFLAAYPTTTDAPQVRLLVGMLYNRYLGDYGRAAGHLRIAAADLGLENQRALALQELQAA